MSRFSANVYFGLSVIFWLAEGTQRPVRYSLRQHGGRISSWLLELSEKADRMSWIQEQKNFDHKRSNLALSKNLEHQIVGIRQPEQNWDFDWDGQWHWLTFDLSRRDQKFRKRLHRFMRHHAFGCIQGSLWVTPFSPERYQEAIRKLDIPSEKLFLMCGAPEGFSAGLDIVITAWDWKRIDQEHLAYQKHLSELHKELPGKSANALESMFAKEASLWQRVSSLDPFLPRICMNRDYPGYRSWSLRRKTLQQWAVYVISTDCSTSS